MISEKLKKWFFFLCMIKHRAACVRISLSWWCCWGHYWNNSNSQIFISIITVFVLVLLTGHARCCLFEVKNTCVFFFRGMLFMCWNSFSVSLLFFLYKSIKCSTEMFKQLLSFSIKKLIKSTVYRLMDGAVVLSKTSSRISYTSSIFLGMIKKCWEENLILMKKFA